MAQLLSWTYKWGILAGIGWFFFCPLTGYARQMKPEGESCNKYEGLKVPHYRVAKKYRTDLMPGLALFVSIAPSDYGREKLLTLVCKLARDHANEEAFYLWVFDDYSAAKRFNPQGEGNDRKSARSFLAWYAFLRDTDEQSFQWRPDVSDTDHWVKIRLEVTR